MKINVNKNHNLKKQYIEVLVSISSVVLFIILLTLTTLYMPSSSAYGYSVALLVFMIFMAIAGLKLIEIPDN